MQKRKYAAIKADPERLERHRERSRTAQYRAYHTRKPHEVARDSLQKRWQDGADRVLEADLGGKVQKFDVFGVFVRDNWTCQVCGGRVEVGLTGREPLSASLDHIVAILRGGDHSPENCQTTHFVCNTTAKQDRPLERARQVATRRDGDVTVRGLHEIASYVADEHPLGHVMDD